MAAVRLGNREVVPATTEGSDNVCTQKPFTLMKRRYGKHTFFMIN